ncbi:MAG: DUF3267 domain-containing protein [Ruminococcus sp.]|nr:DUF3267 domain-containing protein [Ruminococcus sp.]
MAKIKWGGTIKNAAEYQCGELSPDAVKMKMPGTIGEMQLRSLPFMIPFLLICFAAMFVKTYFSDEMVIAPAGLPLGILLGFLMIPLHELLHAVVYPSKAVVTIGIMPKQLTAVALASYPLSRGRFALMSLLPVLLGVVPFAVFIAAPTEMKILNGLMFGMSMMGFCSVSPDMYNVYQMLRQTPEGAKIQFYGDDTYYISKDRFR